MHFLNLASLLWNEFNAISASMFYVSLLDNSRCFSNKCPWGISFKCFCKIIKVDTLFFNLHGILTEYNLYILFFILENESCKRSFIALWAVMCWVPSQSCFAVTAMYFYLFSQTPYITVEYWCQGYVSVWAILWPIFWGENVSIYLKL